MNEPRAEEVRKILAAAEQIVTSDLTLIECDRVLYRAVATSGLSEAGAVELRGALMTAARTWHVLHVIDEVVERARLPFPAEPVRALDAIHLSSALVAAGAVTDVRVLTLDSRVRVNARALGLPTVP